MYYRIFTIMKLYDVLDCLEAVEEVRFTLPNGEPVPVHFHVTEIGSLEKNFIDCGGAIRKESVISFQLFTAQDYDHRLGREKLKNIIQSSIDKLGLKNNEVEVEFQSNTISKYDLDFEGGIFNLIAKQTDCLAKDKCGIPTEKPKVRLSALASTNKPVCEPGSGCC